nr:uncharacterized protein LOC110145937 isoform X1 [Odocoileus virginianus texanus]
MGTRLPSTGNQLPLPQASEGNCGTPQICSEVEAWSPGPTSECSEVTCAPWGPCRWPRRPSPLGPRCSPITRAAWPCAALAPVSGSMSEAPRHWSWATPPAHGAVDGGVTAETPEVTVPGSWGQGAGPPGLSPRRFYPKPGAGLCLATSHLHFQVRPLPSSRVVLQAERLRSPRRQQQVAQTIQTPSSAPAGPAPGCRCPPPPTATRNAVGKTTSTQGSQQFERAEFLCPL